MTTGNGLARNTGSDEAMFSARITPHRSLGANGLRIVMTLLCLASLVSSVPFVVMGAWPVAGFFGLDLVAVYVAFRINFRDGRAFEDVILTPVLLLLRKVSARGEAREWRFNPLWTKLDRVTHPEFGVERLALVSRGESVVVAQALSAGERASFADALGGALNAAKRGR